MKLMWIRLLACVMLLGAGVLAHNVPSQLPDPTSADEAWNVLESSAANIDTLLDANLLRDITFQIANSDGSLRYLGNHSDQPAVRELTGKMLADGSDLIAAIRDQRTPIERIRSQWIAWRAELKDLESRYPPELLKAQVYICPMHPLDRHLKADDKCSICGMSLIRRRLPASGVYEKPGTPTLRMDAVCPPLVPGRPENVTIHLRKGDGSPVTLDDLLEMHTKKIHMLINDLSLDDYHHEHPVPTGVPGEYRFSFTPARAGSYRIWADVVPIATSIQEYLVADLPAADAGKNEIDRQTSTLAKVNGRNYELVLNGGKPVRTGQTVIGTISIAEPNGEPCKLLEPLMGAFAHIVGFNEDRKTVLHIHPYGREPASADERAGPAFAFKFYAPSPGFYRLYGQVQIGGVSQFAPFGLVVLPGDAPATRP
jgi:hypothetical protein